MDVRKEYLQSCLFSCLVMLIPILLGLIFWDRFPEDMRLDWGPDGVNALWKGRVFCLILEPAGRLLLQLLCIALSLWQYDRKNDRTKVYLASFVLCILPAVSLNTCLSHFSCLFPGQTPSPCSLLCFVGMLLLIMRDVLPELEPSGAFKKAIQRMLSGAGWRSFCILCGLYWVLVGFALTLFHGLVEIPEVWTLMMDSVFAVGVPLLIWYLLVRRERKIHS